MPSASSTEIALYDPADKPTGRARKISDAEAKKITATLQEFGQYQSARAVLAQHCEEVAELLLPTSRNTFFFQNYNTPGSKKTQQQVDATGALALHRFCAISDTLVTPRTMQWHGLQGDDYVMKDRASRLWFENTTKLLFRMRYAPNANFASQNYNNWQSIGAFGNATMFVDKFDNRWHGGGMGFRYKAVPFGETFYGENHQGKVDRLIRWFRLTPYQAEQKFGYDWLPENLRAALDQNSLWGYSFLHCVKPREDYDPEALDERSLRFESYYISVEGRCLMAPPRGFRTFPYAVSRYDQTPGEVYGRGPAMLVLPALKTLNAQKITFLKQGHRAADPPLLVADDGIVGVDFRAGALNKGGVNSDGKPLVHILPTGDIKISIEMMQEERAIVDDVFLVTIMKTLVDNPNMTATQVVQLVNERGMLVAPTLGRQHTDYACAMVPRELDLAAEMGMLDPVPPRLREALGRGGIAAIGVTDTSPLSQMAQGAEVAGFFRLLEQLREVVNVTQNPGYLDRLDFETAIPEIARNQLVPERWITTDQKYAGLQQQRAKAAAQKQATDALPAQAAIIKARAVAAKSGALEAPQQGGM